MTANWKTKQAIKQWEIEIFEDPSQEENFEFESTSNEDANIITGKFRLDYDKKLEETYAVLVNVDKNFECEKALEAKNIILQR